MAGRQRPRGTGSITLRKDGRYMARFVVGPGQRITAYFATKKEAQAWLNLMAAKHARGEPLVASRRRVADFAEEWLEENQARLKPTTTRRDRAVITTWVVPRLGTVPLAEVTPAAVQGLLTAMRKGGLAPSTIIRHRTTVHRLFAAAQRLELILRNPVAAVAPPRVLAPPPLRFDPGLEERIRAAFAGHRLEQLVTTALRTGLRESELLGLEWDDIDWEGGVITLRRQRYERTVMDPKSRSSARTLPMAPLVRAALTAERERALREWGTAEGTIFRTRRGTPYFGTSILRQFQRRLAAAGLPRLQFHETRRIFASMLAARGVHPRVAQELLGHADIQMTMRIYTRVASEDMRRAMERLDDGGI